MNGHRSAKNGFLHKALNAIKRLAAFKNPDFYKAQAMRLPTFDKPRIIPLSQETSEYLGLPRGCEIDLVSLLDAHKVDIEWVDESCSGRLHRLYQSKSEAQIYDYVDVYVGVLERTYQKRVKGYAAIGYSAKGDSKIFETVSAIFNNNNFSSVFNNDILSAKNEIIIVSPYIRRRRLAQMLNILVNAVNSGVRVTVVTRPVMDYREKDRASVQEMIASLKNSGVDVILKANIHQKFAVIDHLNWKDRLFWRDGKVNVPVLLLLLPVVQN